MARLYKRTWKGEDKYFTPAVVAAMTGMTEHQLDYQRQAGTGLPFLKDGCHTLYWRDDVIRMIYTTPPDAKVIPDIKHREGGVLIFDPDEGLPLNYETKALADGVAEDINDLILLSTEIQNKAETYMRRLGTYGFFDLDEPADFVPTTELLQKIDNKIHRIPEDILQTEPDLPDIHNSADYNLDGHEAEE